jgi:hypothetical protein
MTLAGCKKVTGIDCYDISVWTDLENKLFSERRASDNVLRETFGPTSYSQRYKANDNDVFVAYGLTKGYFVISTNVQMRR